ncbi:hypothetical protein [Bdellovibrio svalbardensis]|uniref:Uncharacterized protein n=1 Tax=Bdellovibrio svalbardensis TaxID=2972972 RepID=A0ABT6DN59_9BACT|nr:hypothetical protein [Bdellovibrio svalbardensis]MDG0818061.1 hypothetical protein [Bdellovibrio svalbardensis]
MNLLIILALNIFALSVRADDTSPLKSERPPEFNRPIFFQTLENELKIKKFGLSYNLDSSKGQKLVLGSQTIDGDSFTARLENNELNLKWNKVLIAGGEISIINKFGEELWKIKTSENGSLQFKDWNDSKAPRWKDHERFRFCLRSEKDQGHVSLCSQWYGIETADASRKLLLVPTTVTPQVIIQSEQKKGHGFEDVEIGKPVHFFARLANDATYEFVSTPAPLEVKDMIATEKPGSVMLTGGGLKPLAESAQELPQIEYGKTTRLLGFERTIAEPPRLWQVELSGKEPTLDMPGVQGGLFTHALEIQNPPQPQDRIYVSSRALIDTYSDKDEVTYANSLGELKKWEFPAERKFSNNTVTLDIPADKIPHKAYLEPYRGAPREASLRLTEVLTTEGSYALLGEGHFAWWFNDVLGSQNYYLSKQRWGLTTRYFASMTDLPTNTAGKVRLQSLEADLRYRFSPGLWGRDETVGAFAAYDNLTIGELTAPMMGAGLFWARSMPRSIDSWLNGISFLNHPKWFSLDLVNYFSSLDSQYSLGQNYALNANIKMMSSPGFFWEGGLGVKKNSFDRSSDGASVTLTTFFISIGVGLDF